MKIAYISYERPQLSQDVYHTDINEIKKHGIDKIVQEIKDFAPDLIIEREFNDMVAIYDKLYRRLPDIPKAFWAIDTHLQLSRHQKYSQWFDYVFLAISKYVDKFTKPTYWLPLYFPGNPVYLNWDKEYDISFIGRHNRQHGFVARAEYIDFLKATYNDQFHCETTYQTGGNMPLLMGNSRLSFNCSIGGDLNFRVFEAMGYGSMMITDSVIDLYKIKTLADRLIVYEDKEDLKNKANNYLALIKGEETTVGVGNHANKLRDNQKWIYSNHCLQHRIDEMLEMIETKKQKEY